MNIIIKFHLIALVVILTDTASSSPIEKEVQLDLVARVDGLQSKVDQLVIQLEEEKLLRGNFQFLNAELERKIQQLAADNAKKNEQFETKISLLVDQNVQQEGEIQQLKNELRKNVPNTIQSSSHDDEEHRPMNKDKTGDGLISNGLLPRLLPPASCRQLSIIGHYLDGFYLVANPNTNKIETVYCDFAGSTISETPYGNVDVKTKSVHFLVQRTMSSHFGTVNAVIPFDTQLLNEGGAMNLTAGVFTAPVNGIYHFEFKGMKHSDAVELFIYLQVNGINIGTAYATNLPNYLALSGIAASLRLETGDQVRLFKTSGTLHDSGVAFHYTFFTGWLVEEDLILQA